MPYINLHNRQRIDEHVEKLVSSIFTPGELNYTITTLIDQLLDRVGFNYDGLNSMVGVLECVKLELYRRVISPYEDVKKRDNGDVYLRNHTQPRR